jgi:tyrosyl-tRNA synthetase
MSSLVEDLQFRGLIHQTTDDVLLKLLDEGGLCVYAGFDPTHSSLQVGNLLQLCTLRRLQEGGHRTIVVNGGVTGFVGDPSLKEAERQLLDEDQLAANLEAIGKQLSRFLDFSGGPEDTRAVLVDNASWLATLPLPRFLREVGKHVTVNEMIAKESVRSRVEQPNQSISYTEFSYMLLQAYDYLTLHRDYGCDLQIGGSDQWGNIVMGVELVRKVTGDRVFGLTSPLVLKEDGTKFGKSEQGAVWLAAELTSPYRLHQFFINTPDSMVGHYLRFFTFLSHAQIIELEEACSSKPQERAAQHALADEVVAMVHGPEAAAGAQRAGAALFDEELGGLDEQTLLDVFEDAPSSTLERGVLTGGLGLVEALVDSGLTSSKGQARRDITSGGIYLNNRRIEEPSRELGPEDLLHDRYLVLRKGRRQYHLLRVK